MNFNILTDSCFWIALFDPISNIQEHQHALSVVDDIVNENILIPWPTLYEFVNTRLARRQDNLLRFHQFLRKPNVHLIDDAKYKNPALEKTFEQTKFKYLTYSLIDQVLREMILDPNLKFDFLVTFNKRDFEDVCAKRGIIIL